MLDLSILDFEKNGGLVTVVTQDAASGSVLMVAHIDRQALDRTLATGEMHYFSHTRGVWHEGAASGNTQKVVSLRCRLQWRRAVGACHPPRPSVPARDPNTCFVGPSTGNALAALDATIAGRAIVGVAVDRQARVPVAPTAPARLLDRPGIFVSRSWARPPPAHCGLRQCRPASRHGRGGRSPLPRPGRAGAQLGGWLFQCPACPGHVGPHRPA